ncbi:MAG: hypothetical protein J6331_07930 [Lentisphaeria bacterium]|nr:hypothetical protein [Lentisphaeria bacterium]
MKTKTLLAALFTFSALALFGAEANAVRNPNFAQLNDKGLPKDWGVDANAGVLVKNDDGSCSFKLTGRYLRQILFGQKNALFTPKTDKNVVLTIKASGKGKLNVSYAHFTNPVNEKGKRYNKFINTTTIKTFTLSDKKEEHKVEFKIIAGEFCQMLMSVGKDSEAVIDEVSVVEIPSPAAEEKK